MIISMLYFTFKSPTYFHPPLSVFPCLFTCPTLSFFFRCLSVPILSVPVSDRMQWNWHHWPVTHTKAHWLVKDDHGGHEEWSWHCLNRLYGSLQCDVSCLQSGKERRVSVNTKNQRRGLKNLLVCWEIKTLGWDLWVYVCWMKTASGGLLWVGFCGAKVYGVAEKK